MNKIAEFKQKNEVGNNLARIECQLKIVGQNFGFDIESMDSGWLRILLQQINRFSDADIQHGVIELMKLTHKEFSERYKIPYGKPPSIAMWVEFFSKKKREEERENNKNVKELIIKEEKEIFNLLQDIKFDLYNYYNKSLFNHYFINIIKRDGEFFALAKNREVNKFKELFDKYNVKIILK